jgi:hypothetical protein
MGKKKRHLGSKQIYIIYIYIYARALCDKRRGRAVPAPSWAVLRGPSGLGGAAVFPPTNFTKKKHSLAGKDRRDFFRTERQGFMARFQDRKSTKAKEKQKAKDSKKEWSGGNSKLVIEFDPAARR